MIILKIFLALGIPTSLGFCFLRAIRANEDLPLPMTIPCGFGLGMGFLSHWMLLLTALHVRYSVLSIHLPLSVIIVLLWIMGHKNCRGKNNSPAPGPRPIDESAMGWRALIHWGLLVYIAYMVVFVCARALIVPVMEWDAISWIALKGKIFFYQQGIYPPEQLPNSAYPLHIPLSLAWVALNLGEWSETLVKIIFPTYFILFVMFFYAMARLSMNRMWAKASLALLLSVNFAPYHATIAYRDTIMMFYFCLAILTILLWRRAHNDRMLLVTAVLLGLGSFVKLEGVLYLGLGLTVLSIVLLTERQIPLQRRWYSLMRVSFVSLGIFLAFFLYKNVIGATGATQDTSILLSSKVLERSWRLLGAFFKEMFLGANWHILWVLFFGALLSGGVKKIGSDGWVVAGTVLLFLLLYFGLGTFTGIYVSLMGIGSSGVLSRILIHVYPLAVWTVVVSGARGMDNG